MTTIHRIKTETTIETTRVTVIRNSDSAKNPTCEKCGKPIEHIEEQLEGSLEDNAGAVKQITAGE